MGLILHGLVSLKPCKGAVSPIVCLTDYLFSR
jgi:hypothetical protein